MNLGQLIDAERVQRGLAAPRPTKPSAQPPLGTVTRTSDLMESTREPAELPSTTQPEAASVAAPAPAPNLGLEFASAEETVTTEALSSVVVARAIERDPLTKRFGGKVRTVLLALSLAEKPLYVPELRAALGRYYTDSMIALLVGLKLQGDVRVTGRRKQYQYELTEQGRARLK